MSENTRCRRKRPRTGRMGAFVFCLMLLPPAVLALPAVLQSAEVVDRIVAVVNEEVITLYELDRALEPYAKNIDVLGYSPEQKRAALFQFRQKLLNEMISQKLTEQEIDRYKIAVGEEEIDAYIERIKETKYLTDEDLRRSLIEQGLTMEAYRDEIKLQIQRTRLVNREVKSKVVITRQDIEAYYEAHRDVYGGARQFHLWNLFVRFPSNADSLTRRTARDSLEEWLKRLNRGASFAEMVRTVNDSSEDVRGTDLGLFELSELSAQLQETVGAMQPGGHSDILETGIGYQIVYLQEIVESPAKPLAEVEPEIQETLYREIVDNKFQVWLEDLRKRSHIKIIN